VAWVGDQMLPEVRYKLLKIAKIFIEYLEIDNFLLLDIVLTGSNANYNWTKYSDFDLHIVTDYSALKCDDLAEAFYSAKKKIWNDEHDIMIRGHEVELYVEDNDQPPKSSGMFSLLDNKWLAKPELKKPDVNDAAVNAKVRHLINIIDRTLQSDNTSVEIKRLLDKIYTMRKAGLASAGEFGTENLAFKILRNQGYLSKIKAAYGAAQDRELGL
jgi:hypothetical protein